MFSCDFLFFVDISFHFVYISRSVTHSVQRVLVKISFHTSVLICKAETSVFVNKVPVLSCSISGFFNVKHTKIDFGRPKLGVIFTFKTPCI